MDLDIGLFHHGLRGTNGLELHAGLV
jgi:hypothetical protein